MTGAYRPLDDSLHRLSRTGRVDSPRLGLSEIDAYELLSETARIHLDAMVDPNYVVVAFIDKKYLPAKKKPSSP